MKTAKLMLLAAAHFAAFQSNVAVAGAYEKRDDASEITKIGDAIEQIGATFEEYKKTNDARLKAVEEGKSTSDFDAKLARMDEALDAISGVKSKLEKLETRIARPGFDGREAKSQEIKEETEYRDAFCAWMRNSKEHRNIGRLQEKANALGVLEQRNIQDQIARLGLEGRATQTVVGTSSAGGYALPKVIESQIARLSVDISPIRQLATVRQVSTTDYHEIFDINGAGFEWLGETDTRNQTNSPDLADIVPTFGMASAKPQASEESMNDLFFNVEDWLINSAGESIGQGEGAAFVAGNGTKKPTGFLAGPAPVATADSARAFGTLQYIASGQAAALPTNPDIFLDTVYSLRARYRANARWVMAKLQIAALRKYKDSTNQYLWQPSLQANQPDAFLGYGITEAEDMPAVAANAFPIAFGDFKEGYLICDLVGMRITRDEITTPGMVKFYIRRRVGGKLRNTQAIKLLKIATS